MAQLGRYETLRPIASGGMATVHLARALGAGGFERLVAMKLLHPHIQAEPEFVSMFLDEARLAAQIRHPNVVATIDVSSDPLYLVMEYVEGPSLHAVLRHLRASEPLPLPLALRVMLDVLAGLHAAHELCDVEGRSISLVHRDVSPHNILLGVDGVVRLTDFGVARADARLSSTQGGHVKGKLAYMSPEQVRGARLDRRSDVYAAGVVLHELFSNQPLFVAENEAALVVQVYEGVRVTPRERNAALPVELNEVCMRALRESTEERYQSAAELSEALETAALAAGVPPASPRALSAYVRSLALHESPDLVLKSGSGRSSLPSSEHAAQAHTPLSQPQPQLGPPPKFSPNSSTVGTVVQPQDDARSSLPRWKLALAGAGLLAAGALIMRSATPRSEPTATAAQGTSAQPSAGLVQVDQSSRAAPTVEPVAASARTSASASAAGLSPPTPKSGARPPARTGATAKTPAPMPPTTDFRPGSL